MKLSGFREHIKLIPRALRNAKNEAPRRRQVRWDNRDARTCAAWLHKSRTEKNTIHRRAPDCVVPTLRSSCSLEPSASVFHLFFFNSERFSKRAIYRLTSEFTPSEASHLASCKALSVPRFISHTTSIPRVRSASSHATVYSCPKAHEGQHEKPSL